MYNTHLFSTATVVTQTRLNVTLYVSCLSYFNLFGVSSRSEGHKTEGGAQFFNVEVQGLKQSEFEAHYSPQSCVAA
jgi:hypothetical protein